MNASWKGRQDAAFVPACHLLLCTGDGQCRIRCSQRGHLGGDALISHHGIHELKAAQRFTIGHKMFEPRLQPLVRTAGLHQCQLGSIAKMRWQLRSGCFLSLQPIAVAVDERLQPCSGTFYGRRRQSIHGQQRVFDVACLGLRGFGDWQPCGPHRGGVARALLDRPVHRAGPADRILKPVAVLQVQALNLGIVFR